MFQKKINTNKTVSKQITTKTVYINVMLHNIIYITINEINTKILCSRKINTNKTV